MLEVVRCEVVFTAAGATISTESEPSFLMDVVKQEGYFLQVSKALLRTRPSRIERPEEMSMIPSWVRV